MSVEDYGVEMTDAEIAAFLARRGHGVLTFGGETPYGLPVSFGYDVFENRCIFQLVFHPGSEKQSRLSSSDAVTLVAYEWESPDDWRSVIVRGELQRIEDSSEAAIEAAEIFSEYASVVGLEVFEASAADLDPEWFELDVSEMSGRHAPLVD